MHSEAIYDRINELFMSVLYVANRVCSSWGLVFLLLSFAANSAHAQFSGDSKQPDVTIVLSEEAGSYVEFSNALDSLLSARSVSHRVIDSTRPIPASGLVIGVGMKAATVVAASDATAVLNVLITKASYTKLLRDFPARAGSHTFSAIYLDQPIRRQARLITAIFPGKRNVGLLYSTPPKELALLRRELNDKGLTLHEQAVGPELSLSNALKEIQDSSEVLLALPDAEVYNELTIRNILLATYRDGIPLIGFSSGYVRAGALCAMFSTPAQIATQTAALIRQFGETHALPATQYPLEFEVMVNEQIGHALGLQVKGASALHDQVNSDVKEAL
jgi:putative tryptophan/tyrosine transport system substrate-binding protein